MGHGGEFKLGEELAAGGVVDGLGAHVVDGELDGDFGVDGDELFGEEDVVAVVLQRLAIGFALDGVGRGGGGIERGFHGAELLDEFDGTFVADAGRAGDVVDGVAAEGHDVDDALGRNAKGGFDAGGIEDEVVFGGIKDRHARRDELHHVLVGRHHVNVVIHGGKLVAECADDVVGLEALVAEDGDAESFERAADVGKLLGKIGGHLGAVGLVAGVVDLVELLGFDVPLALWLHLAGALVAEDGAGEVVDGGEVLRREVLAQLVDHVDEDVGGGRRNAGARGHGPLALHGVVGAKDERHGVQQVDGRSGRRGLLSGFGFGRLCFGFGWAWHCQLRIPSSLGSA